MSSQQKWQYKITPTHEFDTTIVKLKSNIYITKNNMCCHDDCNVWFNNYFHHKRMVFMHLLVWTRTVELLADLLEPLRENQWGYPSHVASFAMLHSSLTRSSSQLPILRVAYYASLHMLSLGGIILLAEDGKENSEWTEWIAKRPPAYTR